MPFSESDRDMRARVEGFKQELRKAGWSQDFNLHVDERWPSDDMDRVRSDAAELLNLKPDAILVAGRRAVAVLQQQTRSTPVVFAGISEPVETGLVASLAKPGGNFTGFTLWEYSIVGKMMEVLKEVNPSVTRQALVYNPDNPAAVVVARSFEAAAVTLAIRPTLAPIHTPGEIERAVKMFAEEPNGALLFPPDVTIGIHREFVTRLVSRVRLLAVYGDPLLVAAGGLMSYGPDRNEIFRRAASYVDRILRGEKPGDLPVQQPTSYQLVINLKAAKSLGLTLPPTLLARADEVIE
jgi:putative tryptophan/tyrosine transport system substrate-binding protein